LGNAAEELETGQSKLIIRSKFFFFWRIIPKSWGKKNELEKEMENIWEKHEWGETTDGSWSIALIMTDTSNNILPEN